MPRLTMLVDITASASRARHEKVGRVGGDGAEEHQQHDGHDDGNEQALAPAQGQDELDPELGEKRPHSVRLSFSEVVHNESR